MSPKTLLLIGRSGAGKGTQARLLNEYITKHDTEGKPLFYVETGARFRQFIKTENYTSALAGEISAAGLRQPDFLAIWNWADLMVDNLKKEMHLVMDGAPRSLIEAQILETAFTFYNRENPTIIYVNVSPDWTRRRLKERGRADDANESDIENKIKWFDVDVMPALQYFKTSPKYLFIEVSGEQPIEKVQGDIISALQW